jgi:hypothetical protein
LSHYPDKPSRLDSCFACTNETTLRFYVRTMDKKSGFVASVFYEVEKVDQTAPEHRADFNVVQPLPGLSKSMKEIAHAYWEASLWITVAECPGVRCEEIVTTSPLRIIRQIAGSP